MVAVLDQPAAGLSVLVCARCRQQAERSVVVVVGSPSLTRQSQSDSHSVSNRVSPAGHIETGEREREREQLHHSSESEPECQVRNIQPEISRDIISAPLRSINCYVSRATSLLWPERYQILKLLLVGRTGNGNVISNVYMSRVKDGLESLGNLRSIQTSIFHALIHRVSDQ